MHALGAWLRTQFDVRLVAGEQLPYGDFVERLSKQCMSVRFGWSRSILSG